MGKRYDKEFKIETIRLASEPGNTQAGIERDLGIGQGVISRWETYITSLPDEDRNRISRTYNMKKYQNGDGPLGQ